MSWVIPNLLFDYCVGEGLFNVLMLIGKSVVVPTVKLYKKHAIRYVMRMRGIPRRYALVVLSYYDRRFIDLVGGGFKIKYPFLVFITKDLWDRYLFRQDIFIHTVIDYCVIKDTCTINPRNTLNKLRDFLESNELKESLPPCRSGLRNIIRSPLPSERCTDFLVKELANYPTEVGFYWLLGNDHAMKQFLEITKMSITNVKFEYLVNYELVESIKYVLKRKTTRFISSYGVRLSILRLLSESKCVRIEGKSMIKEMSLGIIERMVVLLSFREICWPEYYKPHPNREIYKEVFYRINLRHDNALGWLEVALQDPSLFEIKLLCSIYVENLEYAKMSLDRSLPEYQQIVAREGYYRMFESPAIYSAYKGLDYIMSIEDMFNELKYDDAVRFLKNLIRYDRYDDIEKLKGHSKFNIYSMIGGISYYSMMSKEMRRVLKLR